MPAKIKVSYHDMVKHIPCNICGCSESKLLFVARDLNYRTTDEEFNIVKCSRCGLVYLNPQPLDMAAYYPKEYLPYKPAGADNSVKLPLRRALELFYRYPGELNGSAGIAVKLKHMHKLLELILKDKFFLYRIPYSRDKKILDVGCGNGGYLLSLKALGWDAPIQLYGIDFPSEALRDLQGREQVNIIEGNFLSADLPEGFFDILTLRHVLEHLPDPASAVKKAFSLLKPGGLLLINVPNFKSAEALLIFKEEWRHIDAPRHLFHFSPKTLSRLLKDTGFFVEELSLKRASSPFIKSLEYRGYHVPKPVEKYVIRNMLKVFKILGYSGEILCRVKKGQPEHRKGRHNI